MIYNGGNDQSIETNPELTHVRKSQQEHENSYN